MKKMRIGETRGITLIGLVVAIIVLVLLAGVAMASFGGNDGIIENASVAVEQYKEKASEYASWGTFLFESK